MKKWMALLLVCTLLLPGLAGAEGSMLLYRQTLPAGAETVSEINPKVVAITVKEPGLLTRMGIGVHQNHKIRWEASHSSQWNGSTPMAYSWIALARGPKGEMTLFGQKEDQDTLYMEHQGVDGVLLMRKALPMAELPLGEGENRFEIGAAEITEDGWLLLLRNVQRELRILRLDGTGVPVAVWDYQGNGQRFDMTDAVLHDGALYLSGHLIQGGGKPSAYGDQWELEDIEVAWTLFGQQLPIYAQGAVDFRLTPRIRAHYTAVLLRVDPVSGEIGLAHTADGCLSGRLRTDEEGRLTWDVQSLQCCACDTPAVVVTFFGTAKVYRCAFDEQGALMKITETEETVGFLR